MIFLTVPGIADPHRFDAAPDSDLACYFDVDLDPEPSFQIKAQNF
jgi:hypothetical protein